MVGFVSRAAPRESGCGRPRHAHGQLLLLFLRLLLFRAAMPPA